MLPIGMSGSFAHKLDGKGRVVLPSRFREHLGVRVYAAIGIGSERFISVYPAEQWEALMIRLSDLVSRDGRYRNIQQVIVSSAHEIDVDNAGRILVYGDLRSYASITQDVSVNGVIDHIEIWDAESYSRFREDTLRDRELIASIPL